MPLDEATPIALNPEDGRSYRSHCLAYVTDAASEAALQEAMADMQGGLEFHRGGVKAAIAAMQRLATPRVLIIDISEEDAPLAALEALSDVVEPHVCVLVVGTISGLDFYREVTRGVGVAEYLVKPLTREMVTRHFGPLAQGRAPAGEAALGGRMITVTGVRGGAGATTIATNLAWHFGVSVRRHTVLLDPDIHFGTAGFMLNVEPGVGLAAALRAPDRIDSLLAERAAVPVDDRLHLLAGQERLDICADYAPDAAKTLLAALRRRYNFIVADVPYRPLPLHQDLLDLSHRRVLVLDPSLASVRDTLRLIALPASSDSSRAVLVLNRAGRPGGLSRRQIEDALQRKLDVVIPDQPKLAGMAATLGKPVAASRGVFRDAILALTREVAFSKLIDSAGLWEGYHKSQTSWFGRLLKGKA